MPRKPRIALVLGDPAGIGPELVARLLADAATAEAADVLLIAAPDEVQRGMQIAQLLSPWVTANSVDAVRFSTGTVLLPCPGAGAGGFERGVSTASAGRHVLETLKLALAAQQQGVVDAIVFAPLNKHALHLAGMGTADELHWFAQQLGHAGPVCELNVLDGLWTSRVTSHIALADVPRQVTQQGVIQAIALIHQAVAASGVAQPRIAVCGLNPHNGDNGSFGREEIDIIAPAVQAAAARGLVAQGPFAADTIFLKVQGAQRAFDGVVTMYHDQGQIAMKLMGFWRGVTVQGGLPVPITTPAHGTAFDIAGQGIANPGAMQQAFALACRMATARI